MFVDGEGWLPSAQSMALVSQCAEEQFASGHGTHRKYFDDHKIRIAFDLDYAARFLRRDQSILEIGAYPYFLTVPLMRSHYSVTTLDLAHRREVSDSARRNGVRALSCDLDQEPIPAHDATFDVVIMNEVFEHLRINLINSMREVARVLKPGGLLLLSTPNLRSFRGIYNFLVRGEAYAVCRGIYENYALLESHQVMGHVREYTSREVQELLERVGFAVKGTIYRGQYGGSPLWNAAQLMTRIMPQFKPFFSMVANRPVRDAIAVAAPAIPELVEQGKHGDEDSKREPTYV